MHKVLISIPENLAYRLRASIPSRQRSRIIARLITEEIERRENNLYVCALEVEKDEELNAEMKDWDITANDGMEGSDHESW